MEYRNPEWKKEIDYLIFNELDSQQKPYFSDGMNNRAINTDPDLGNKPYPNLI